MARRAGRGPSLARAAAARELERHSLKDPFQLSVAEDEPIVNPALVARLKQKLALPPTPADWDEKKPDQYLAT